MPRKICLITGVLAAVSCIGPRGASAAFLREAGREQVSPPIPEGRVQTGFLETGAVILGAARAVSARPDGSGSALFKYQGALTDAVNSDRLQFLADMVFLTARDASNSLKPVSFDYLLGAATRRGDWRLRFDREEALTLAGGDAGWRHWDVRASRLFGSHAGNPAEASKRGARAEPDGWSGTATVGYFLKNDGASARLDGTGLADLRYELLLEGAFYRRRLLLRADADMLTDRGRGSLRPVDLDLALGAGTEQNGVEVLLLRRSRESLDRPGYAHGWFLAVRKRIDSRDILPP